ncbi:hypothetical protein [Synechocystis sp. LKSZ1]|uniref:hypothetical protein n=1 Tax=Synechocystis sp. LKSZ1 TaxID=3144951 RepID=UPI00336BBE6A
MNLFSQPSLTLGRRTLQQVLAVGLLVLLVFAVNAGSVQALTEPTASQATSSTNQTATPSFNKFLEKTQRSYDKALAKTQQAIADLSQQLAQISTTTDIALRKQLKDSLEDKQDDLENAADKFDDLAEKLQSLGKKLTKTQDPNQANFQANVESAQLSLSQLAQSLDTLADSTEKAKKGATAEIRTQIDQQIQGVQQALDQANQTVQNITQAPA